MNDIITDEDAINVIIEGHPDQVENEKPYMVVGNKSYSINDVIREMKNKTEFGNNIINNLKHLSKIKNNNL